MGEQLAAEGSTADRAAIEVRLYAEDPSNGFLPAIGTIHALALPDDDAIRWDLGVQAGSEVTIDFDPMIGKVTASGPDRTEAARRLATALEQLHLGGIVTNREFLVSVLRSPEFLAGDTTTDFIERVAPSTALDLCENGVETAMLVGALWLRGRNHSTDGWWGALPIGFRNGRLPPTVVTLTASAPFFAPAGLDSDAADEARVRTVAYRSNRDGSIAIGSGAGHLVAEHAEGIELDGTARIVDWTSTSIEVELGRVRQRHLVTARTAVNGPPGEIDRLWVQMPMGTVELVVTPKFVMPGAAAVGGGFTAPMPGKVLEVRVAAGDTVTKGQTLLVLEAMKMEQHMTAPDAGVVAEVFVSAGQQVAKDEVLLRMEEDDEGE